MTYDEAIRMEAKCALGSVIALKDITVLGRGYYKRHWEAIWVLAELRVPFLGAGWIHRYRLYMIKRFGLVPCVVAMHAPFSDPELEKWRVRAKAVIAMLE